MTYIFNYTINDQSVQLIHDCTQYFGDRKPFDGHFEKVSVIAMGMCLNACSFSILKEFFEWNDNLIVTGWVTSQIDTNNAFYEINDG